MTCEWTKLVLELPFPVAMGTGVRSDEQMFIRMCIWIFFQYVHTKEIPKKEENNLAARNKAWVFERDSTGVRRFRICCKLQYHEIPL